MGRVTELTKPTAQVSDKYRFDAFGVELPGGKMSPNAYKNLNNPFGYNGEQYDPDAGMSYLRNRYYEPDTGRFMNRDLLPGHVENPLSMNAYAYVTNNPLKYVDPLGLEIENKGAGNSKNRYVPGFVISGEREIWKQIADKYFDDNKNYYLTADLLRRSLTDNPHTVNYGDNSYAAKIIKNNEQFYDFVGKQIEKAGNVNKFELKSSSSFDSGDLFYAIHKCNVTLIGSKNKDGTWTFNVTISDVFDFTEFKTPFDEAWRKSPLGWTGNDVAYLDEKLGVINPVDININFKYSYTPK